MSLAKEEHGSIEINELIKYINSEIERYEKYKKECESFGKGKFSEQWHIYQCAIDVLKTILKKINNNEKI